MVIVVVVGTVDNVDNLFDPYRWESIHAWNSICWDSRFYPDFERLWTTFEWNPYLPNVLQVLLYLGDGYWYPPKSGGVLFCLFHSFFEQWRFLSTEEALYPHFHPCYPQFGAICAKLSIPKYGLSQAGRRFQPVGRCDLVQTGFDFVEVVVQHLDMLFETGAEQSESLTRLPPGPGFGLR